MGGGAHTQTFPKKRAVFSWDEASEGNEKFEQKSKSMMKARGCRRIILMSNICILFMGLYLKRLFFD